MKKLRVCVVTGTRAEFGIWRPVLRAVMASKVLELQLVVTGTHLMKGFGETVKDIEAEGIAIAARVGMYQGEESAAESLARGVRGLAEAFRELRPGVVMVLGDRLEMLAAASAALAERIAIGHVHGGETAPGVWDEQIRHAITKMAQVHFCATETARRRIVRMGEDPRNVHRVGAPAIDLVDEHWRIYGSIASKIRGYRNQGKRGHGVVLVLHPTGGTDDEEFARVRDVLRAIEALDLELQVIGPNNDPGHAGILRAYREAKVPVETSVSQDEFWHLVMNASGLVGNSSAGIIEAASLGVPVVNIGARQAGRERNENVVDAAYGAAAVTKGIERAILDAGFRKRAARRKNLYGDGQAAGRIVGVLEEMAAAGGVAVGKRFVD